jgi:serine/threonine protein kinase
VLAHARLLNPYSILIQRAFLYTHSLSHTRNTFISAFMFCIYMHTRICTYTHTHTHTAQRREQEEQRAREAQERQQIEQQRREQEERERPARVAEEHAREAPERDISDRLLGDGPPVEVPAELVKRWTNNFERKIGEGAFGDVFEGILADSANQRQAHVAVKRLKPEIRLQGDENEQRAAVSSIRREIHVLSAFRHPHIIRLLGYTSTSAGVTQELCLVYELGYASLDKMLTDGENAKELSCKVRVRIAADISRALNYLHCHDPRGPAFHRDVKSANIVLDLALSPKLIDCGLSKFVPDQNRHGTIMSTRGASLGTPGYMCPTYMRTRKFDAKSENYSFGIVLVELLLGRLQGVDENDLYGIYIEEKTPISNDLDMRAGPWIPECADQLEALARECLSKYLKRIPTMMTVMRRLVALENEFCRATAEEVRLTRLAEEMKRELEVLRFEASTQADAREREQQQCIICYEGFPVSAGLGCESSAGHFICADCAPREVQRILAAIQEAEPLARHREQGGRIICVQQGCVAPYAESALARVLPDALFREYRAAQDAVVEQRLFEELQQRFQEQLEVARREFENANHVARAEQGAAATAEFMRRQYPDAVQCPRCSAGPVIPENCYNLQTHHGESSRSGRGRISNACPSCGFFSRERGDWVRWDGLLR